MTHPMTNGSLWTSRCGGGGGTSGYHEQLRRRSGAPMFFLSLFWPSFAECARRGTNGRRAPPTTDHDTPSAAPSGRRELKR